MTHAGSEAVVKALKKAQKLIDSRDLDYIEEEIKVRPGTKMVIEVARFGEDDEAVRHGEVELGEVAWIEPYIVRDGRPVDGISAIMDFSLTNLEQEFGYLIGMYCHSENGPGRPKSVQFE